MRPPKNFTYDSKRSLFSPHSSLQSQTPAIGRTGRDAFRPKLRSKFEPETAIDNSSKSDIQPTDTKTVDLPFLNRQTRLRLSVQSPRSAAKIFRERMSATQEELWVLALCPGKRILGLELVFRGTVDCCQAHPRDIFRYLCVRNASSFIIAHNHPSQDPAPSANDWQFTQRLSVAASIFGISLVDHVIVTRSNHRSLAALRPELFGDFNGRAPEQHLDFS
jgi:DNA repair protein RadC